jgi:hypothetical protein
MLWWPPGVRYLKDTRTNMVHLPGLEFLSAKQLCVYRNRIIRKGFQHLQLHLEKAVFPLAWL